MIYLLLGPSGSGKTTLGSCLRDMDIPELISTTTRSPREGESEGNPYYFVPTFFAFEAIPMVEMTEYANNWYGTSVAEVKRVLSSGKSAFAIVDKHGCNEIKKQYGDSVKVIYIWLPQIDAIARMRARGDSEEAIISRMQHAFLTGEFDNFDIADYCVINKNLDDAAKQLKAIVGD